MAAAPTILEETGDRVAEIQKGRSLALHADQAIRVPERAEQPRNKLEPVG